MSSTLIEKYTEIEHRYRFIEHELTEQAGNLEKYQELAKKYSELEELVTPFRIYKKNHKNLLSAKVVAEDAETESELKALADEELQMLQQREAELEEGLRFLLIPKDPLDNKSCYLEIRAGTGGDEAGIFAGNLYEMYSRYIDQKGWSKEVVDFNTSEAGGFKEMVVLVKGIAPYGRLKFEAGTHRVQRVPATEASGRVHTSAATVAVLPEAKDVEMEIRNEDLRIDTYRASGAGGQHINRTDSAVRITHLPTGIVVSCQDGRSQYKNKDQAMGVLKAKLLEKQIDEKMAKETSARRLQVGSGDRSEKIRTYNYPQSRLTDHRINFTSYNLQSFLDGNLDELIDALIAADRAEKLASA